MYTSTFFILIICNENVKKKWAKYFFSIAPPLKEYVVYTQFNVDNYGRSLSRLFLHLDKHHQKYDPGPTFFFFLVDVQFSNLSSLQECGEMTQGEEATHIVGKFVSQIMFLPPFFRFNAPVNANPVPLERPKEFQTIFFFPYSAMNFHCQNSLSKDLYFYHL